MAPPSNLPSAAELANEAKHQYDAMHGRTRPPLPAHIEEQAEFFFKRGELNTIYFANLIDQHAFSGQPNNGHYAAADLLITRAFRSAITTNVDALIETAGQMILGDVTAVIDGQDAAALPDDVAPLLKLHGCRTRDCANMVWAPGQLTTEPVLGRIENSKNWLNANLVNKDILIVGYWTDWDYLNTVLSQTLNDIYPSRVIVINPEDTNEFRIKAPALFALGHRSTSSFDHVKVSGHDFLHELRRLFSRAFIRRILHSGSDEYQRQSGVTPQASWLEPPNFDSQALWKVRRDLEGRLPDEPAKDRNPPLNEPLLGLTLLQLQAKGASADGAYWLLNQQKIRVLRASNSPLHHVKSEFYGELAPAIAPDLVIAVGAEELSLPTNVARPAPAMTVARGQKGHWVTRQRAVEILDL